MSPLPGFALAAALPGVALAERLDCRVTTDCTGLPRCAPETMAISFTIDRTQFARPVDAGEPPRVKRTMVTAGPAVFAAEPIVIGDTRGFWENAEELGARMLTIAADGSATYTETAAGLTWTGSCEETTE